MAIPFAQVRGNYKANLRQSSRPVKGRSGTPERDMLSLDS